MAKEVELTPTQQAIAANDARIKQQTDFDPAKHGVGTVASVVPENVHEMYKWAVKEINKLHARIDSMLPGDAAQPAPPLLPAEPEPPAEEDVPATPAKSAFAKKKESIQ